MLSSRLRMLALTLSLVAVGTPAQACCLFGGGGWGAWRPLSWTGFFGPRPTPTYYGGSWGGSDPCCNNGCGTGGCNSCGTSSYYGPTVDNCGSGCGGVATNCCSSQYAPTSNEPVPDTTPPANPPATDNFRSAPSGGSSIPRGVTPPPGGSSIPPGGGSIPPGGGSIPPFDRAPSPNTGEYGTGRDLNERNDYLNGTNDAPLFQLPRPAEPNPTEPQGQPINIEPLDLNQPVVQAYRPSRERVRVWSNASLPQVAAQSLPTVRDNVTTPTPAAVASR